ncbi:MAG: cupin domain-containing protein [Gammaproteobacteria bacterium]
MLIKSIREKAKFGTPHFEAVTLDRTDKSDMKVVAFEPGQAIPVHHPNSDLTMVIIEGEATLVSGNEELAHAGPGAVLHSRAGEARGIHADKRTIVLVVASPPPTPEDHREIKEHFAKGTWR